MMNEYNREAELQYAQEMVTALREAYKTQAGRGGVKAYKIKDREMTFQDAADVLKQLQHWQRRVRELEQQLYEVFHKYADKRQSEEAGA